jgi:hypothetical protein
MTGTDDWWDRLYDDGTDGAVRTAPAPVPAPAGSRLPDWRTGEDVLAPAETPGEKSATAAADQEHAEARDGDRSETADKTPASAAGTGEGVRERVRRHVSLHRDFDYRTRALAYNGAAAGAGWALGLVPTVGGWITDCGSEYSITAALILGTGICVATAQLWDRRTRGWWPPLAWFCRIPLASCVIALGLYAPASTVI